MAYLKYNNKILQKNFSIKIRFARLFPCILIIAALMLISSPISSQQVFATHLSEELKWQLVFISARSCSLQNFQMMNQYDEITEKYLELYGLETSKYDSLCIGEKEYLNESTPPQDLDLIILVYDKELGEKVLHSQKMGGLYSHTGSDRSYNHVVIICDCSNFYYSDPVWILTHELSHFVMYYRNYDMSVIEDLIHANDEKYDQCFEKNLNCEQFISKLEIESIARTFSVMPIYTPDSIENIKNDNVDEKIRTSVIGISKMITKWWAADKITDGDYANAIGFLIDSDILPSDENSKILIADDPIDDQVTWEEKFLEINSELRGETISEQDSKNTIPLPTSNIHDEENKILDVKQVILGMPDWFKTTASWWAQDKITDDEFKRNIHYLVRTGILRPHTSKVFQELVGEESLVSTSLKNTIDDVNSLVVAKDITKKDSKKLTKILDLAITQFDFDNTKNGCVKIDSFIENVSILIDESQLEQNIGQSLINSADIIKLNFC